MRQQEPSKLGINTSGWEVRFDRRPSISDQSPDPGLFGPDSVTWKVLKEPFLVIGARLALLLQVAHPLVAQGALDHSRYKEDPFGRFERTVAWVSQVVFGTTKEADVACQRINQIHAKVKGLMPAKYGTGPYPGGTPYSALDPDLLLWVHATLIYSIVVTYEKIIGCLSEDEKDTLTREWNKVALRIGLTEQKLLKSWKDLLAYVSFMVLSGHAVPGEGSKEVAKTILKAHTVNPIFIGLQALSSFFALGLLPAMIRNGYGVRWTPLHSACFDGLCQMLKKTINKLPEPFRSSPVYRFALERSANTLT